VKGVRFLSSPRSANAEGQSPKRWGSATVSESLSCSFSELFSWMLCSIIAFAFFYLFKYNVSKSN